MRAIVLRDFLAAERTVEELGSDLADAFERTSDGVYRLTMDDLPSDFVVTPIQLARVCDAVIDGALVPESLRAIGFGMIASDRFTWDVGTDAGKRVSATLHEWASPEANFALSVDTAKKFRDRLVNGVDRFGRDDHWKGEKGRIDRWEPRRQGQ